MFAMAEKSNAGGEASEGSSTQKPIRLEGVSASDFERLLRVLYTP